MKKIIYLLGLGLLTACHSGTQKPTENAVQTVSTDSIQVLHGQLIIGHETQSFTADGDTTAYWINDPSGQLESQYKAALPPEASPYTAVPAQLKVHLKGPATEGFATEYDGVMEVVEILSVGK